jgi:hypothetical protein
VTISTLRIEDGNNEDVLLETLPIPAVIGVMLYVIVAATKPPMTQHVYNRWIEWVNLPYFNP